MDHLFDDGVFLHQDRRSVYDRVIDDAAEAQPRHARADPRALRHGLWRSGVAPDDLQGSADRLQPRPPGRQAHLFRAYDTVTSCLAMATAIVGATDFVRENIEPTLGRGFLDATSLAEYFVLKGIPFRTAHHMVGSLVARCEREGKMQLSQLSLADFAEACAIRRRGRDKNQR